MKFKSIFCSIDKQKELLSYLNQFHIQKKEIYSAFGINIHMMKALPAKSALLVDYKGNIVAVFNDGKLVEIPQEFAVNHLAEYPSNIKKTPGG